MKMLVAFGCILLTGCMGSGWSVVRNPEPGCRTIIASESAGSRFVEEAAQEYATSPTRGYRLVKKQYLDEK